MAHSTKNLPVRDTPLAVLSMIITGIGAIIAALVSSGITAEILRVSFPEVAAEDLVTASIVVAIAVSSLVISSTLWLLNSRVEHQRQQALAQMREKEKDLFDRIRTNTEDLLKEKSPHAH